MSTTKDKNRIIEQVKYFILKILFWFFFKGSMPTKNNDDERFEIRDLRSCYYHIFQKRNCIL